MRLPLGGLSRGAWCHRRLHGSAGAGHFRAAAVEGPGPWGAGCRTPDAAALKGDGLKNPALLLSPVRGFISPGCRAVAVCTYVRLRGCICSSRRPRSTAQVLDSRDTCAKSTLACRFRGTWLWGALGCATGCDQARAQSPGRPPPGELAALRHVVPRLRTPKRGCGRRGEGTSRPTW